mmetsp:Transcript_52/g.115  ORF Transcript_52/g.115 Transcript_52/m.115 type:complete len:248 (+) Transcript_52:106-849(+)
MPVDIMQAKNKHHPPPSSLFCRHITPQVAWGERKTSGCPFADPRAVSSWNTRTRIIDGRRGPAIQDAVVVVVGYPAVALIFNERERQRPPVGRSVGGGFLTTTPPLRRRSRRRSPPSRSGRSTGGRGGAGPWRDASRSGRRRCRGRSTSPSACSATAGCTLRTSPVVRFREASNCSAPRGRTGGTAPARHRLGCRRRRCRRRPSGTGPRRRPPSTRPSPESTGDRRGPFRRASGGSPETGSTRPPRS